MSKSISSSTSTYIKKRSCTDVLCLIVFFACLLGMFIISMVGFVYGDLRKILKPTDSLGNICGIGDYKNRKYLMFFDLVICARMAKTSISKGCPTPQVCVEKCTNTHYVYTETYIKEKIARKILLEERKKMLCKYDVDPTKEVDVRTLVNRGDCAAYYVKTTPVFKRCIPTTFKEGSIIKTSSNQTIKRTDGSEVTQEDLKDSIKFVAKLEPTLEIVKDILSSWRHIAIGSMLVMILSLIWIILMKWFVGLMVWINIAAVMGFLFIISVYSFYQYARIKYFNETQYYQVSEKFSKLNEILASEDTWFTFGLLSSAFLVILMIILGCVFTKIRMTIELLKECSRAIGYMVTTLIWPVIPYMLIFVFMSYWIASMTYVITMGKSEYYTIPNSSDIKQKLYETFQRLPCTPNGTSESNKICAFAKYGGYEYKKYMELYLIFMLFWVINFIIAFEKFVLAGAFASYYWALVKPRDIPNCPLWVSVWRAVRYHLGSLALGSIILSLVQIIRILIEYIQNQLDSADNKAAEFIKMCVRCIFWCFEKFVRFLTKNAYIMIAVRGQNFCFAARAAFILLTDNLLSTVVLDQTADIILFSCKLVLVIIVFMISSLFFQGELAMFKNYVPELNSYLVPVLILTLITFLIASTFFEVYGMAVCTMYMSFLEDKENNDGSEQRPYFMTKTLMDIFGKTNYDSKNIGTINDEMRSMDTKRQSNARRTSKRSSR